MSAAPEHPLSWHEQARRIRIDARRQRRELLRKKFGGRCAYCNTPTGRDGTIDHYVPKAHGGTNTWPNLRWSCRSCNETKGDMQPHEWEQWLSQHRTAAAESRYEGRVRLLQRAIWRAADRKSGGCQ